MRAVVFYSYSGHTKELVSKIKEKYGYAYHKKPPKCVEMIYDTSNLLNKN